MFDELCYNCNYYWMNNTDDMENSCHGDPMIHGCVPDELLSPMIINYSDEKVIKDSSRKTIFLAPSLGMMLPMSSAPLRREFHFFLI